VHRTRQCAVDHARGAGGGEADLGSGGYGSANDVRKAWQAPSGVDRERLELNVEDERPVASRLADIR
jgi:hypothetical protein